MSSWPQLEAITSPHGAQAAACQVMVSHPVTYPKGFVSRNVQTLATSVKIPGKDAAMWFKQMHAGYMAAQFVSYSTDTVGLFHLQNSERLEICHSAKWDAATLCGYSGTLRPRRVSVTLQINSARCVVLSGHCLLDALTHWSQFVTPKGDKIVNHIRLAVLTGEDAENFYSRAVAHSVHKIDRSPHYAFRISVRWFTDQGHERTESKEFQSMPPSSDSALATIQQTVVLLAGKHDVPIHLSVMAPVAAPVPAACFTNAAIQMHRQFESLVCSEPHCTFDPAASHPDSAPLENTGVVVRLCMRRLGKSGVVDETAFHGALLSFSSAKEDAIAFAKSASETKEGYLGVPIGMQESSMALHVCAVHVERRELGTLVTLYGPLGKCGQPIHERGGAWVWVESAAIRPLDASLMQDWCVYPCAKSSIMPGNAAFHEPFRTHFSRASVLYTKIDEHRLKKAPSSASLDTTATVDLECLPQQTDSNKTTQEERTERQVLAALRVGLDSQRTTVGEACAYLMEYDPLSPVVKMLMTASYRLGVGASLSSMITLCSNSMLVSKPRVEVVEENTKLKRLLDVALAARATDVNPKRQKAAPVQVDSNERVRRMLKSCCLARGMQATIHRTSKTNFEEVVETISKTIYVPHGMNACYASFERLGELKNSNDETAWEACVMDAIQGVILGALRYAHKTQDEDWTSNFVLSSRVGKATPSVAVSRMNTGGEFEASSFDAMLTVKTPRVLIVNFLDKGQVRLTGTTSA